MGAIEDEVSWLFEISCAAVATNWACQNPVLSDQPIKL